MIKVDAMLTRSRVSAIKKTVDGDLKADIDKYKTLSEKLNNSKSDFNVDYCDALNTEGETLENIRLVYSSILNFITNVMTGLQQMDATLIKR